MIVETSLFKLSDSKEKEKCGKKRKKKDMQARMIHLGRRSGNLSRGRIESLGWL